MIFKMTDLMIRAPCPLKRNKQNSISLPYFYKDGSWGFGKVSKYFKKFSAWVIDFIAQQDDQEWYLSVLKRKLFKDLYTEGWLNGKRIFLYNVI